MANTLPRMRGRSEHSLDEKGRVIIPLKFRETIGNEFMLVTAPGPCLRIYPMAVFEKMEAELESGSVLDEVDENRQILQRMFYDGDVGSLDQQFRLTLPRPLRNWANFGRQDNESVIIIGMGDKIELWSHYSWDLFKSTCTTAKIAEAGNSLRGAYQPVMLDEEYQGEGQA